MQAGQPTRKDWPFDDKCPECGEDVHLGAVVKVQDEDGPKEAELVCGTEPDPAKPNNGCGNSWEWKRKQ